MYHLYHHQLQIALFYGLFSFHTRSVPKKEEKKSTATTHKCVMEYLRETLALFENYIFEYRWTNGTESTNATIFHDKPNSNEWNINWKNTFLQFFPPHLCVYTEETEERENWRHI